MPLAGRNDAVLFGQKQEARPKRPDAATGAVRLEETHSHEGSITHH
jgi:hypothetical protein